MLLAFRLYYAGGSSAGAASVTIIRRAATITRTSTATGKGHSHWQEELKDSPLVETKAGEWAAIGGLFVMLTLSPCEGVPAGSTCPACSSAGGGSGC
jgi:hypothetical protein